MGERGDGDETDVCVARVGQVRGQTVGAFRGQHTVNLIALGERRVEWRVLEVPHEGRGIEEVDGGDAQDALWTRIRDRIHASLEYQSQAEDAGSQRTAMPDGLDMGLRRG